MKAVNVRHHKVGETDEPSMYRIKDDLVYYVEVYEWAGTSWEPYVDDDLQIQFYMMSPYVLKTLSTNQKGLYYSTFKVPDVYGVFQFKVEYQRLGYTTLSLAKQGNRRETRLLGILSFIHSTVWKVLFGKVADSLEKGTEHEDEYMISEKELLVNRFISIPKDMGAFNCGAFVAGIVKGVLDNAGFPAVVTAHFVPVDGQLRPRTTILIKFAEEFEHRRYSQEEIDEVRIEWANCVLEHI